MVLEPKLPACYDFGGDLSLCLLRQVLLIEPEGEVLVVGGSVHDNAQARGFSFTELDRRAALSWHPWGASHRA